MSENRRKVEPVLNGIIETPNDIEKEMELQYFVYDDIDKMSMRSNISFYCILDFNTLTNNCEEMMRFTMLRAGRNNEVSAVCTTSLKPRSTYLMRSPKVASLECSAPTRFSSSEAWP